MTRSGFGADRVRQCEEKPGLRPTALKCGTEGLVRSLLGTYGESSGQPHQIRQAAGASFTRRLLEIPAGGAEADTHLSGGAAQIGTAGDQDHEFGLARREVEALFPQDYAKMKDVPPHRQAAPLSVRGLRALLHGVDQASHTIRPHRALPRCNRAGYQGPFLGGDRPHHIALETVCVDDLASFDQPGESATGVPML
jgi:hypothetical protein